MSIHIILDSSIVWNEPYILEANLPNVQLFIPEVVFDELMGRRDKERVKKLWKILEKTRANFGLLTRPKLNDQAMYDVHSLGDVDAYVLHTAIQHTQSNSDTEVILATDDTALLLRARKANLVAYSYVQLKDFLNIQNLGVPIQTQQRSGKTSLSEKYTTDIRKRLIWTNIVSLAAGAAAWYSFSNLSPDVGTVLKTTIVIFAVVGGPLLYLLRSRYLLTYAGIETAVGFGAVFAVVWNDVWTAATGLQLMGGLYIIVRGMDNIEKATEGGRFNMHWRAFFRGEGRELKNVKVIRRA